MQYEISDDPARIDLDVVYRFLSTEAYWGAGLPRDVFERAVANSLCLGVYTEAGDLVGFARVVTDRATFSWLCDVFILGEHRGRGLGKRLMDAVHTHPDLQRLRRMMLATADAQDLYARYNYRDVRADILMEHTRPATELFPDAAPAPMTVVPPSLPLPARRAS
ncbi:MAG TPA: GNAT family N-acetyltransferase [Pseudonocardiaceae bacterium]